MIAKCSMIDRSEFKVHVIINFAGRTVLVKCRGHVQSTRDPQRIRIEQQTASTNHEEEVACTVPQDDDAPIVHSLLKEAEVMTGNMNQQVDDCDGSQPMEVDQVSRKRDLKMTDVSKHKSKIKLVESRTLTGVASQSNEVSMGKRHELFPTPNILSRIVSEIVSNNIIHIKRLGGIKALVEVKTAEAANRMVANPAFEKHKLKVFIPSFRVLRTGTIKRLDQSLSIDCIKENIRSPAKILDMQRLNRRMIINNQATYIPSRTLCIKFAGQSLPSEIVLFNALYTIEPYIPKVREHDGADECSSKGLPHSLIMAMNT
ncbi:hypothetical protein G5I_02435 [Acromyrmex echinatior]|uniref:Uncharacterized protein n=1 Tax=Acromyrmex echinatior TaxID=103372 RepID=F4WAA5_ACREC|nr:hypothetical protein G5I_02435 [Acromyrmex echinatior]